LQPLLICRRLLPAFVGRAGADQVHVGAQVLLVLAGAITGAAFGKAEIVRSDRFGITLKEPLRVAAEENGALQRAGILASPVLVPLGQVLDEAGRQRGHERLLPPYIDVALITPLEKFWDDPAPFLPRNSLGVFRGWTT